MATDLGPPYSGERDMLVRDAKGRSAYWETDAIGVMANLITEMSTRIDAIERRLASLSASKPGMWNRIRRVLRAGR